MTPAEVQQRPSHVKLLDPGPTHIDFDWPETASAPLNAIIVPASRGALALRSAIRLSAHLDVQLVVLCSLGTHADEVVALATRFAAGHVVAVDIPTGYQHPLLPRRTGVQRFRLASAGRSSDLSLKRNVGLLLARLRGWSKVLFLDDDIDPLSDMSGLDPAVVGRIATELDTRQVAGLVCKSFPDNSVVCHARRLAGRAQDNFVTGGALGVNCSDQPLPFFPDIYNEDWFFFAQQAANRELGVVGEAGQAPYHPYADPHRARTEEFGDLLAEGLYALFETQGSELAFVDRLAAADARYWKQFIRARRQDLDETAVQLTDCADPDRDAALISLHASADQLARLHPRLCVDFIKLGGKICTTGRNVRSAWTKSAPSPLPCSFSDYGRLSPRCLRPGTCPCAARHARSSRL